MLSAETFDLLQSKRTEHAGEVYQNGLFERTDPRYLVDKGGRDKNLRKFGKVTGSLYDIEGAVIPLPPGASHYDALYATSDESAELVDERSRKLSVFILQNRPPDMGSWLYRRIVLSDSDLAIPELVDGVPLGVAWGRPMGVLALASPLLEDGNGPNGWLPTMNQVLDELDQSLIRR